MTPPGASSINAQDVRLHDSVDFWRVSAVEPGSHLQLSAEMRLPGQAWLEWRVGSNGGGELEQTAYFRPRGLAGRAYWYLMLPFHHLIFGRMARRIVEEAERDPAPSGPAGGVG